MVHKAAQSSYHIQQYFWLHIVSVFCGIFLLFRLLMLGEVWTQQQMHALCVCLDAEP